MNLSFSLILEIVTSFYAKATSDILIGYHFRDIEDFESHLPRIASFWQLQLTGIIDNKAELPFKLIPVHEVLKLNRGEVFRWAVLFENTLDEYREQNRISTEDKIAWMKKVEIFKERILNI